MAEAPTIPNEHPKRYRGMPDTPNERLRNLLDEAAALTRGTDDYLRKCTSAPSDAALALEKKTFEADWKGLFERGETMFEFSEVRQHVCVRLRCGASTCVLSMRHCD